MNGIDLVVDTNVLINLSEGKEGLDQYLNGARLYVSSITEIEILGWPKLSKDEEKFFRSLLGCCQVMELNSDIKDIAIQIKRIQKVKIPDAIICATSLFLEIPLLSYDHGLSKIKNLNLILLS